MWNWLGYRLMTVGILALGEFVISGCGAEPPYSLHPMTSMVRAGEVGAGVIPPAATDVTIERVQGEWSYLQVVVKPGTGLPPGLPMGISCFRHSGVGGSMAKSIGPYPEVYQVLPVNYRGPEEDKTFQVPPGNEGAIPDICVRVQQLPHEQMVATPILTLLVALPPGDHDEQYDLYMDPSAPGWLKEANRAGLPLVLPIHLHTVPVKLPDRFDFMTATTWNFHIEKYIGRELTAEERRDFIDFFLDYRMTPAAFFGKGPGFSAEELKHIAERGGSMFQVLHLGGNGARELTEKQKADFTPKLADWRKTMDAAGVGDRCYAVIADEPAEAAFPTIRKSAEWLKVQWPELKIWVASRPVAELLDVVDAWDVVTAHSTDLYARHSHTDEGFQLARAAAKKPAYWWFFSVEPYRPEMNCRIDNDLIDCRAIGWKSFAQGVDGFEYFWATDWAKNTELKAVAYPEKAERWDLGLSGAGQLCYPMEQEGRLYPIPSLRLMNLRDGFEDWQLFRMAGEALKAQFPNPDLKNPETIEKMRRAAITMIQQRGTAAPVR